MGDIRIRALTPDDIETLHEISQEPAVMGSTLQVPYRRLAHYAEQLERHLASPHVTSLVADSGDGTEVLGSLGLLRSGDNPRRAHAAGIGMGVRTSAQRRGVGTALMQACVDHADRWLGLRRLELEVYADNEPALRLYRRFGFEEEGLLRRYALRDGAWIDAIPMARLHPGPA